MNNDDQKPDQENTNQEGLGQEGQDPSQSTNETSDQTADQATEQQPDGVQKQPPKIDDFEDFEDWDDANDLDLDNFDEAVLEDDFAPGSIDEDFSDFEKQVQDDQVTAAAAKKGSGGVLKGIFTLVVIGGLIGGGVYGYFTFKDDLAKLIDAQSFVEADNGLSADSYFDDLKAPTDSQEPQQAQQAENYDFANRGGRVDDALPQPTPITDESSIAEPMPIDAAMEEDPATIGARNDGVVLSEVISNGSNNEPLYDILADEAADMADQTEDALADTANKAGQVVDSALDEITAFVDAPLAQETPEQYPDANPVMDDVNRSPFGDPASEPASEDGAVNMAASQEEMIPEELVGEADVVAQTPEQAANQSPEMDMDLFANETQESVEENDIPVAAVEPIEPIEPSEREEPVEEFIASTSAVDVMEDVQVEEKIAEDPAPVSKPAAKVTIEKKKSSIDPDVYASATKEATVYELIQTQDLSLARSAMSQRRYEDALEIYNRLYAKNPDNFEIVRGRNAALKYLGQQPTQVPTSSVATSAQSQPYTQQRIQNFEKPVSGLASVEYARQAVSAASGGNNAAAIQLIEKAMNADPRNAMHAYNAAIIFDRAGDRSSAVRYYEKALELDALYGSNKELPRGQIYDRLAVIR